MVTDRPGKRRRMNFYLPENKEIKIAEELSGANQNNARSTKMSEAFVIDPHRLFEILSTQILSNTLILD